MNLAAVALIPEPFDVAMLFQTVDEFDGAVVLDGQLFRELANGGQFTVLEASDGEKHLILLRFQSLRVRGRVAFAQE